MPALLKSFSDSSTCTCATTSGQETIDSLFRRVVDDDHSAFEQIFRSSYRELCAYSSQLVVCPQLAEEIVDDVFCSLWHNRKRIRINTSFRAYLITSIRNRCLDSIRRSRGKKIYMLEHAQAVRCKQSIAWESLMYEELRDRINCAVNRLPKQCQTIFRMSREEELPYKDIAQRLNISIKTVDAQIGRALKHIRQIIASHL